LAGPLGGAVVADERSVRQGEADRPEHGPPDLRPGRPAAVRRPRLRLRPGPRGRREALALEAEVRPDPGNHQGPRAAQGEEGPEAQEAAEKRQDPVLDGGDVRAAEGGAAGPAVQ